MKTWMLALLLLLGTNLMAQQFGGFPPSTHWKQINSDTVRLIFTPGAEKVASRIATLIHRAAADTPFALGSRLRKVNILLHSQTTLANGYVALAPFKSEFYLIPSTNVFDFGNLPWADNLAIHEYRHVQQYNNFRNGLAKGFYFLFGEQGLAFANGISIPDWFFEGDAVHAETALTEQGRGRLDFFLSGYKSLWLEGRNYSWLKLRNGSMKDYVPDHYQLGYLLVNYGYLKYGNEFWKKITQDASSFKGLFYPMQHAIKKYTGKNYRTFRNEALEFYQEKVNPDQAAARKKEGRVINDYFPRFAGKDTIVFLRSAYNSLPSFYMKDAGGTRRIGRQDISGEKWFSTARGNIVYTAYSTDPRWGLRDYSDIIVLDRTSGKENRITRKKKYFTPAISPSGYNILAVRITDSLHTDLDLMQLDGHLLTTISGSESAYFTNPAFISEHRILTGVRTPGSKMSLQAFDLEKEEWDTLVPASFHTLGQPFVMGDTVYFTGNIYGSDDIYALDLATKKLSRLLHASTGSYFPSASGNSLVYSVFTSRGLKMETKPLDQLSWEPVSQEDLERRPIIFPVATENEKFGSTTERYSSKRYAATTGLFHFHSWAPNYNDPEFTFSLYSDNILNTFSNEFYYRHNFNERSNAVGWNAAYGGWYPVVSGGVEYNFHRVINTLSGLTQLNELEARVGLNIPLDLTKGKTYKFFNAGTNLVFSHSMPSGIYKDSGDASSAAYLHHFINWSHYVPTAVQHIFPKLGYTLAAAHRYYLDGKGSQFLGSIQLFLPSFGNHSLVLSGSFQKTVAYANHGILANRFAGARGYQEYYYPAMWRMSANYHFPIIYPDLGLAGIVYFQRLRGNIFYDDARNYGTEGQFIRELRSVGAEIYFDSKWWNQLPVSFGFRVSHLLNNGPYDTKGSNWFEFIVPLNLIPN